MARIKYIVRSGDTTVINPRVFPFLAEYFDFEIYDVAATYSKSGTLFVGTLGTDLAWAEQLQQLGYRVAVSNLCEMHTVSPTYHLIQNANWFWYQEHFLIRQFGGNQYSPVRQPNKLAFMPIRLPRSFRDHVVRQLRPYLDQFVWSYSTQLPGDRVDPAGHTLDRHFNPSWYDQTYFSLVVESAVEHQNFITEKTFKPLAFQHPFMVIGQQHTLRQLQQLGFVTYDNLFDESYDQAETFAERLNKIENNIVNTTIKPYDNITVEKIQHNYNHFFDQQLVVARMLTEIINPLLEYAAQ